MSKNPKNFLKPKSNFYFVVGKNGIYDFYRNRLILIYGLKFRKEPTDLTASPLQN